EKAFDLFRIVRALFFFQNFFERDEFRRQLRLLVFNELGERRGETLGTYNDETFGVGRGMYGRPRRDRKTEQQAHINILREPADQRRGRVCARPRSLWKASTPFHWISR